jgi:hypothetical protein
MTRRAALTVRLPGASTMPIKGFDKLDDVVISHDDIVPDWRVVVLVWPRIGPIPNAAARL